jgi:hypothetical protein
MSFKDWLQRQSPWSNLISLLVGVLGTAATLGTSPHGEISYQGNIIRLIDADRVANSLTVLDQSGNKIKGNVYAIDIVFWNSGNLSTGKTSDRLREPINLEISPEGASIIDKTIQKVNFNAHLLKIVQNNPFQVNFDWDQFDPGDAFRALIIFEGTEETTFKIGGKVVGVSLRDLSSPSSTKLELRINYDYILYGYNHNNTFRMLLLFSFFAFFVFPIILVIVSGLISIVFPRLWKPIFNNATSIIGPFFIIGFIGIAGAHAYLIYYFASVYNLASLGAPL